MLCFLSANRRLVPPRWMPHVGTYVPASALTPPLHSHAALDGLQGCLATGCSSDSECDLSTFRCKPKVRKLQGTAKQVACCTYTVLAPPHPNLTPLSAVQLVAAPVPPADFGIQEGPCTDKDSSCRLWADAGECKAK